MKKVEILLAALFLVSNCKLALASTGNSGPRCEYVIADACHSTEGGDVCTSAFRKTCLPVMQSAPDDLMGPHCEYVVSDDCHSTEGGDVCTSAFRKTCLPVEN